MSKAGFKMLQQSRNGEMKHGGQNLDKCSIWVLGIQELTAYLPLFASMFEIFIMKGPYWLENFKKRPSPPHIKHADVNRQHSLPTNAEVSVTP